MSISCVKAGFLPHSSIDCSFREPPAHSRLCQHGLTLQRFLYFLTWKYGWRKCDRTTFGSSGCCPLCALSPWCAVLYSQGGLQWKCQSSPLMHSHARRSAASLVSPQCHLYFHRKLCQRLNSSALASRLCGSPVVTLISAWDTSLP